MYVYNPADFLPSTDPSILAIEARDAAWKAEEAAIEADDDAAAFAARGRRLTAQAECDRIASARCR